MFLNSKASGREVEERSEVASYPRIMSLEENLWSNLHVDILDIILYRIPLFYHPSFALVCKRWNAICTHKVYPIDQTDPLLLHVKNWKSGFIHYYSPFWNKTFKVKSPITLSEPQFFSTKDGWLVLYKKVLEEKAEVEVVLVNPTTNVSYSYPGLLSDHHFTGITFLGCPGTKNFVIFAVTSHKRTDNFVRICLWKEGRWKLQFARYDNQSPFIMSSYSSPVEYKDCFCCVSESGRLGVFILEHESWYIIPQLKGFSTSAYTEELYLIESKDKIRVVIGGNHDARVLQVFYLDCKEVQWRKIENLKSCSMFVGPKASIMINFNKKEEDNELAAVIEENVHDKKKIEGGKKEVSNKVHGALKSEEKIDVNGKAMNNRIYGTGMYGNIEVVEAEMKISEGELFFVTKACDNMKSKQVPRKGNIISYSLQKNQKMRNKCYGSSYPVYCAWYPPQISYGLQGQENEK